jgi:hypothetical protein
MGNQRRVKMKSRKKLFGVVVGLLLSSQGVANADFEYDFAPSQWTYTETNSAAYGPSGSLSSSQMQLTSANYSDWSGNTFGTPIMNQKGSYSITIPYNVDKIDFSYTYSTEDKDNSNFDVAQTTIDGVSTTIPPFTEQENYVFETEMVPMIVSGTKSIDLTGKQGKTFSIDQLCNDCAYGSATITITSFEVGRITNNSNVILADAKPTIAADSKGYTCKPGSHSFFQYGITKIAAAPTSMVYTLILNGARVSSVSSDNWSVLSRSAFDTSDKSISGAATSASATWIVEGASSKSAQCEVLAFQDGASALAYSANS